MNTSQCVMVLLSLMNAVPIASADNSEVPAVTVRELQIPAGNRGRTTLLQARLCLPARRPARLVVINHGSPANQSDRPQMKLHSCASEAAAWFLARGYAVIFPLRRGYGATGGEWAEDYGSCSHPDFVRAGLETARDIEAVVNYAPNLPEVRPDGIIVLGQSAGGWGTIAYDSVQHPRVAGFIVMAGGRGGHEHGARNENCRADVLADAAGHFGKSASTPMLWVYAKNDSFFGPSIARSLYHAFASAGGKAEFEQPDAYRSDGHQLFFGAQGSDIWGPLTESYLNQMGLSP